jgi:hypothetical protein
MQFAVRQPATWGQPMGDRRMKRIIVRIGAHPFDISLYQFDY